MLNRITDKHIQIGLASRRLERDVDVARIGSEDRGRKHGDPAGIQRVKLCPDQVPAAGTAGIQGVEVGIPPAQARGGAAASTLAVVVAIEAVARHFGVSLLVFDREL